jgi:hypothetical protein
MTAIRRWPPCLPFLEIPIPTKTTAITTSKIIIGKAFFITYTPNSVLQLKALFTKPFYE